MPNDEIRTSERSGDSLTRRSLLAGTAAGMAALALPEQSSAQSRQGRKVPFGAALERGPFENDPAYAALVAQHCDLIFPMNDLKWDALRHDRDNFDFAAADRIVSLAGNLDRLSHGHTFVWFMALPQWAERLGSRTEAERELVRHIETVGTHYRGRLASWDVVNEVVAFEPTDTEIWRDSIWHRLLGPDHIDLAFKTARAVDPDVLLGINDYDLEFAGPRYDRRRALTLDLVRRLQDRNLSVDYVGFQGHLYPEIPIDAVATGRFIRNLEALGVRYMITELDVIDWKLPVDPGLRDRMAADHVDDFLDATFSAARPISLATWGLSDRYSWISEVMPHRMGARNRPLPFDDNLQAKPMFEVIERYQRL